MRATGDNISDALLAHTWEHKKPWPHDTPSFFMLPTSPLKTFARTVAYENGQLDKCFMPYDKDGQSFRFGIQAPYGQSIPLPVSVGCPTAQVKIREELQAMSAEIKTFAETGKTRLLGSTDPEIRVRTQ